MQAAYQHGRDGQHQKINQAFAQEAGDDARAALHHQTRDAQPSQALKQRGQVHPTMGTGREAQHPRPGRLQRALATRVGAFAAGNPGRQRMTLEQVGIQRETQLAVHHHRLGMPPFDPAHGEARIVGQHGADADQDGIVSGSQLVRQGER